VPRFMDGQIEAVEPAIGTRVLKAQPAVYRQHRRKAQPPRPVIDGLHRRVAPARASSSRSIERWQRDSS
jgi:hypothetical protein